MAEFHASVFGGGSVGLCLAASFAAAGARVSLLVREDSIEKLQNRPIEVSGLLGDHVLPAEKFSVTDASTPSDDVLASDMMFVTTKAYDVAAALAPFTDSDACPPITLLQNGMGSAEIARETLGPNVPIFSTAMMIGMVRRAPTEVGVTAQSSPIWCGPLLGDDVKPLEKMLQVAEQGFVPMQHDKSIRDTIAYKVLFNSCMNPTGAITGQTYGELLLDPNSRDLIVGLADETLAAFSAAFNYRPAESGEHYVDEILSKIIFPRSQGHRSSMLQDLQAGRKTEIDFLNGAVLSLSEKNGLKAERHRTIIQLIKACEAQGVHTT